MSKCSPGFHACMTAAVFLTLGVASQTASAGGNIFLTGHDADLHMFFGSASAQTALVSELAFVRNGSSLPVLTLDGNASSYGNELSADLTKLGIAHTNFDPNVGALSPPIFDSTKYSAVVVASNYFCGGCDNTNAGLANIAAQAPAIASFFNAGRGILGLAGASDSAAYAYVPEAATNAGGNPPSTGFVETATGTSYGLVAENGDPTHNYFNTPGTGGLSSAYVVVEKNGDNVESIALKNGSIACTGTSCSITPGVPEPEAIALMAAGLGVIGVAALRRRQAV